MGLVTTKPTKKIACQQVLLEDSSVFSIQWMVIPLKHGENITPLFMLDQYLHHIKTFTLSLIRPFRKSNGIEFRLLGTEINLISFTGPTTSSDNVSHRVTLHISGGILVQQDNCKQGELAFIAKPTPSGLKVILQLSDYCPILLGSQSPSRWRRLFYRITQAYIHKIVTVKFLSRLYRELENVSPRIRVIKVKIKQGRET